VNLVFNLPELGANLKKGTLLAVKSSNRILASFFTAPIHQNITQL